MEYVKFMQLQIKVCNINTYISLSTDQIFVITKCTKFSSNIHVQLLSSDDMWMYAPLAYNGINVSSLEMHIAALQK